MSANERVFHAIDLDRTLFNTALLSQTLENIVAIQIPGFEQELHDQMEISIQRGKSFFIFEYIISRQGRQAMEACVTALQAKLSKEDLLLPGAKERLAFAASRPEWGVGIITYGSPVTQKIKLHLCGLDTYRCMITNAPAKSSLIASWQQPTGEFILPEEFGGETFDTVVLDDDKLEAFQSLPDNSWGNWITTDPDAQAKLGEDLRTRVEPCANLDSVVASLKIKLA